MVGLVILVSGKLVEVNVLEYAVKVPISCVVGFSTPAWTLGITEGGGVGALSLHMMREESVGQMTQSLPLSESGCFLSNKFQYQLGIAWILKHRPKKVCFNVWHIVMWPISTAPVL